MIVPLVMVKLNWLAKHTMEQLWWQVNEMEKNMSSNNAISFIFMHINLVLSKSAKKVNRVKIYVFALTEL